MACLTISTDEAVAYVASRSCHSMPRPLKDATACGALPPSASQPACQPCVLIVVMTVPAIHT